MFPEIRSPRYVPPEEDFWKVYDLTSGQDRVMLSVFLYLAARRGEVLGLQWTDVDFPNSRIRLGTRKRRDGTLEFDWLPMNTELEGQLRWWHENRVYKDSPHVFVCDEDYSYCREYRGGPFTKRCHFMHRMCGRAKVPPFGFHAIRHLVASKLYRMGKPLGAIQAILRHKSAGTTERYLKSLGLEETRVHLEALCDMRSPVKEANEASGKKPAKVINIKDRLEKRSQAA
jgi:integrase